MNDVFYFYNQCLCNLIWLSFFFYCWWRRWWVVAIPDSCIVIAWIWNHDGCHNCCNVECGPNRHEFVHQILLLQVDISPFLHSVFDWNSSRIMHWVRLISVVVCLNQEPCLLIQFIESMNAINFSFDNGSFIFLDSWNHIVNWSTDSFSFQSFECVAVVDFLL